MKTKFTFPALIISFLVIIQASGQDFCGTVLPDDYKQHLLTKDRSHLHHAARSSSTLYVPIQYHIIGENDGSGYFTTNELVSLHCSLNEALKRADIQFYFYDQVHYINNSVFYNFQDFNSGSAMMNQHNVAEVCNVYIVENPAGVCGYAYFPGSGPSGGGIVLNKDCSSYQSTTLAHEMGHYLGLPHTFSNIGGIEYVNGSNCANAGDLFCDTPADFLDFRWSCPYTGNETDPNGDLYNTVIDQSLYMSYSLDECQSRFSLMQEADMYQTLQLERPYLLTHPNVPQDVALDPVEVLQRDEVNGLMSARHAEFKWKKVDDAYMYHFQLTHFSLSFTYDVDILVEDTSLILTNLLTDTYYRWRVKPLGQINTCQDFSDFQHFKTSRIDIDFNTTRPACKGNTDGFIEAIPVSGIAPFTFEWSNGSVLNPIGSLAGGIYQVTVTDAGSESIVFDVDLTEPAQLEVDITFAGGQVASASAIGGTPPYAYQWGDGTMGQVNSVVQPGNLVAYVTDANGCVASRIILVASDGGTPSFASEVKVFPNPIGRSESLMINLSASKQLTATIGLYSSNGQWIRSVDREMGPGEMEFAFDTNGLADGVYILKVVSPQHRYVERLVIAR